MYVCICTQHIYMYAIYIYMQYIHIYAKVAVEGIGRASDSRSSSAAMWSSSSGQTDLLLDIKQKRLSLGSHLKPKP